MAKTKEMLGRAVFERWSELPQDIQELLFSTAVKFKPDATERLAMELHDRDPRTAHPPKPIKSA